MYIEFTKDHTSGIKVGTIIKARNEEHMNRLIKEKYAKESTEEEYLDQRGKEVDGKLEKVEDQVKTDKEISELIAQLDELDHEGLKVFVENQKLDIEVEEDMPIEDARETVALAIEEEVKKNVKVTEE